jgi:hypothetical protein
MSDNEDVSMDEYEVESILEKRKMGGKWKYKIKWVGYPEEQCTWEPVENLDNVQDLLEEFEANFAKQEVKKQLQKGSNSKDSNLAKSVLRESNILKKKEEPKKRSRPQDYEDEDSTEDTPKTKTGPLKKLEKSRQPPAEKKKSSKFDAIVIAEEEPAQILGSMDLDKPLRLITAKLNSQTNEVQCLVEWDARQTGIKPSETYVSNKLLREKFPYLLLDFYESRLRFPPSTQEKK